MTIFGKEDVPFLAGLLVAIILCFSLYSSRHKVVAEILENKQRVDKELQRKDLAEEQLVSMKVGMDNLKIKLASYENRLPQKIKIEDFIRQIEKIEKKSGFLISGITPHSLKEKELYSEVPITLKADASYNETYKFISFLNDIPRVNRIESVNIKKISDETNQCEVKIELKIFTAKAGG